MLAAALAAAPSAPALGTERQAATAAGITAAIAAAAPGDVIAIAPGVYDLPRTVIRQSGRPGRPVTVRASRPGTVEIRSRTNELFKLSASDWIFEDLDIVGACATDTECEHAFHVVGGADRTILRGNRLRDFNAQIKGNGEDGRFPRDVVITGNTLFATRHRAIELPLAMVDVVGGRHWIVRGNLFADFGKVLGHPPRRPDDFAYAVFLKGSSSRGVIANNLVACSVFLPPAPYTRALSLGGSGTTPGLCETDCAREHADGLVRANVVINCPTGVGIYLYKASGSRVLGNTLIDTEGLLARAPTTTAQVTDNIISGRLAVTDGAELAVDRNVITGAARPPLDLAHGDDDFCGDLQKRATAAAAAGERAVSCGAMAKALARYRRYAEGLQRQPATVPFTGSTSP